MFVGCYGFNGPLRQYFSLYRAVSQMGWSGGAMVLGKLPVPPGRPTNLDLSRARPTALAIGAGGGCLDIFSFVCHLYFLSPSLWEPVRYGLKYRLKGSLNPKQPTNQPTVSQREGERREKR